MKTDEPCNFAVNKETCLHFHNPEIEYLRRYVRIPCVDFSYYRDRERERESEIQKLNI